MNTLTTLTGKQFDCGFLGEASVGVLYAIIENSNIGTVATVFSNSAETGTLTYEIKSGDTVVETKTIENYTVMVSINQMQAAVRVGLRRPYVGETV